MAGGECLELAGLFVLVERGSDVAVDEFVDGCAGGFYLSKEFVCFGLECGGVEFGAHCFVQHHLIGILTDRCYLLECFQV